MSNLSSDPESEISNVEYLTLPGRKKRVLLSAVNQRDRSGRSLLYKCAGQGLAEAVKVLCEAGAQVNIKDNAGWSPLHEATVNGHEIVVKYLLEAGANVNSQGKYAPSKNKGGNLDTPLHDAVESGHAGVVDLLLSHGASLELRNKNGQTAQDVASNQNIIQLLNEWKINTAKVLTRFDDGKTVLHKAVAKGSVSAILDCLKYGSDINARDNSAWTPLHEACLSGNLEIVELLLSYGADIHAQALDNDTPLHQACANNFGDVVNTLLWYGADPQQSDAHSRTPAVLTESDQIKNMLNAPKGTYLPYKAPKYLPRIASELMEDVAEEVKNGEMTDEPSFINDDTRRTSDASFASTREERKFQALLKKLEQSEQKTSNRSDQKDSKRYRKFGDDFPTSSSDSEGASSVISKKSKNEGFLTSLSPSKSTSPVKKPYTGKPRGRKPKQASIGSSTEVERIISEAALDIKSEDLPRRGRPPKIPLSRVAMQSKHSSSESDNESATKFTSGSPEESVNQKTSPQELKGEVSPKKRGRKPKSWHLENQRLIQQRQLEKLSTASVENTVRVESEDDKPKEEMGYNTQPKMHISPTPPITTTSLPNSIQKPPIVALPIVKAPPPAPVFVSPIIRKKAKKKSWIVSGYQSLESPADPSAAFEEEMGYPENVPNVSSPTPHNGQLMTFIKKNCLPLYIITLPSSRSRYFLDIQLGLFLQYSTGRAFLDSIPGLVTRIAATAEKQCMEQSAVSETIYSSMTYANESAARWIKTVSLHAGHVGLKMTDLDIHFVKEDDVKSRLNSRIKVLSEQLNGEQVNFFDEIFIGKKEDAGPDRLSQGKSSPTGGYVHKLKRHANK